MRKYFLQSMLVMGGLCFELQGMEKNHEIDIRELKKEIKELKKKLISILPYNRALREGKETPRLQDVNVKNISPEVLPLWAALVFLDKIDNSFFGALTDSFYRERSYTFVPHHDGGKIIEDLKNRLIASSITAHSLESYIAKIELEYFDVIALKLMQNMETDRIRIGKALLSLRDTLVQEIFGNKNPHFYAVFLLALGHWLKTIDTNLLDDELAEAIKSFKGHLILIKEQAQERDLLEQKFSELKKKLKETDPYYNFGIASQCCPFGPVWWFYKCQNGVRDPASQLKFIEALSVLTAQYVMIKGFARQPIENSLLLIDMIYWLKMSFRNSQSIVDICNNLENTACEEKLITLYKEYREKECLCIQSQPGCKISRQVLQSLGFNLAMGENDSQSVMLTTEGMLMEANVVAFLLYLEHPCFKHWGGAERREILTLQEVDLGVIIQSLHQYNDVAMNMLIEDLKNEELMLLAQELPWPFFTSLVEGRQEESDKPWYTYEIWYTRKTFLLFTYKIADLLQNPDQLASADDRETIDLCFKVFSRNFLNSLHGLEEFEQGKLILPPLDKLISNPCFPQLRKQVESMLARNLIVEKGSNRLYMPVFAYGLGQNGLIAFTRTGAFSYFLGNWTAIDQTERQFSELFILDNKLFLKNPEGLSVYRYDEYIDALFTKQIPRVMYTVKLRDFAYSGHSIPLFIEGPKETTISHLVIGVQNKSSHSLLVLNGDTGEEICLIRDLPEIRSLIGINDYCIAATTDALIFWDKETFIPVKTIQLPRNSGIGTLCWVDSDTLLVSCTATCYTYSLRANELRQLKIEWLGLEPQDTIKKCYLLSKCYVLSGDYVVACARNSAYFIDLKERILVKRIVFDIGRDNPLKNIIIGENDITFLFDSGDKIQKNIRSLLKEEDGQKSFDALFKRMQDSILKDKNEDA